MTETIVFLSGADRIGGAERSMQELMPEMRARGYRCILATCEGSLLGRWAAQEGFHTETTVFEDLREGGARRIPGRILRFRRFARHLERTHGARIFYSHSRVSFKLMAFLPRRYLRIAHQRDAVVERVKGIIQPLVDVNVFITEFNYRRCGAPANGHVILNAGAIPCDLPPVPQPGAEIRMAMFARFEAFKGHHLALAACELLGRRGVPYTLDLWGEPHNHRHDAVLDGLRAFVEAHGLNVSFRGFHPEPRRAMRDYHCILHPSRDEPFGRVPVEGFSLGVPVIAHASGGTMEIYTGSDAFEPFLFHDYTPEALAGTIAGLRADGGAGSDLGCRVATIQQSVQRRFRVERVVDELEDLLARHGVAPAGRGDTAGPSAA